MYYHFKIPNNNLDFGLQELGNDADVINLVRYVDKYRLIEVYIEHEYTVLNTYLKSPQKLRLEEIVEVGSSALAMKPFKKPGLKLNRLPQLLLEGPSLDDDTVSKSDEDAVNEAETANEANRYDFEETVNEVETVSESDDSQDSDFLADEDNLINEVEVDMQEFYQNIGKDVEWVGHSKWNLEVHIQMDVEEGYDLDDFYMDIDRDIDIETKFADKKDVIALVNSQAVATRRQFYVWKNDKVKVRAVCRGKCPIFNNSVGHNARGLISPSKSNLKQVNRKWVKAKRDETISSGQRINKVSG
ncbi:hypothetical protein Tco_0004358 [Tanacetum coccineum]